MSDSLLMAAWLVLAVSQGCTVSAVLWLLRRHSLIEYRPASKGVAR